ncbi:MAG: hypothetical protein Q7O66_22365, partial [Dehalococcoidia bacterium]|nr:hypothetical protein [Dehalococcoidia bacterium]
ASEMEPGDPNLTVVSLPAGLACAAGAIGAAGEGLAAAVGAVAAGGADVGGGEAAGAQAAATIRAASSRVPMPQGIFRAFEFIPNLLPALHVASLISTYPLFELPVLMAPIHLQPGLQTVKQSTYLLGAIARQFV